MLSLAQMTIPSSFGCFKLKEIEIIQSKEKRISYIEKQFI